MTKNWLQFNLKSKKTLKIETPHSKIHKLIHKNIILHIYTMLKKCLICKAKQIEMDLEACLLLYSFFSREKLFEFEVFVDPK